MKKLFFIPLLFCIGFKLFAQTPDQPFQITSSDYDNLAVTSMNNVVYKENGTNLALMIRRDTLMPQRRVFLYSGYYSLFDSTDVFSSTSGFPNIDVALTGSIAGYKGITCESNSKIAILSNSGVSVHNTPPSPTFVFSNGKIFLWSNAESKLYRSDDLGASFVLIDSLKRFHPDIIYNPQGGVATISKSKMKRIF